MSFCPKIEGKFPNFISLTRIMPILIVNNHLVGGGGADLTNRFAFLFKGTVKLFFDFSEKDTFFTNKKRNVFYFFLFYL